MTVNEMIEEILEKRSKGLIQGEDIVMLPRSYATRGDVENFTYKPVRLSEIRPLSTGFVILDD